jgi:hypothetical protein
MKASEIASTEFHSYFKTYIDKVGEVTLKEALENGWEETISFFESIPESKLDYRYSKDKWTIKDILLHLIDAERAFSYRALQFARSNQADLEGFDENIFVENAQANLRSLEDLISEYDAVRQSSILMYNSFSADILKRTGKANNAVLSVRAAGFLICGHEIHHKEIIKDRYL